MSLADVDICNMALGHLKIGKEISVLLTDKSAEAAACRLFYSTCKQMVMEDFKWPFARKEVALALVQANPFTIETVDGDNVVDWSEWAFAYRYPADAANLIRIISGVRNESRQDRVPYKIYRDNSGKIICCDMENAWCEYTVNESTEDRFTATFAMALSLKLAVYIAPRVTGGDPFKLGDRSQKLYEFELAKALSQAVNEEQMEEDPESESIRARY